MTKGTAALIVQQAIEALISFGARSINSTQYIESFNVGIAFPLAIERERQSIFVWTQACRETVPADFAHFREDTYPASRSRNSNLNDKTAPRLKTGNSVDYWKFDTVFDFERFVHWYADR